MRTFFPQSVPKPPGDDSFLLKKMESYSCLDIEIGCGVGMHPLNYATSNPHRMLIAIERTREKFRKFQNSYFLQQVPNLVPIHADAIHWICHYIKPSSVDRYFVLYPNPYPKNSQANLRLVNMPFTQYLIQTMKSGAELIIASNIESYYLEAKEGFPKLWGLDIASAEALPKNFSPRTHFEKKYLEREEICYQLVYKKY